MQRCIPLLVLPSLGTDAHAQFSSWKAHDKKRLLVDAATVLEDVPPVIVHTLVLQGQVLSLWLAFPDLTAFVNPLSFSNFTKAKASVACGGR